MSALLLASFLVGFLGSMHCVGMCGGLVTTLSMSRPRIWFTGLIAYQFGRTATYTFLGLIAGMVGVLLSQAAWFSDMQRALTIVAGSLMVVFGLHLAGWLADPLAKGMASISSRLGLTRWIHAASTSRMPMSWFMVGLFNGLLPCGLVYAGLTFSLTSGNIITSAAMMFAFGLGTIPAMMFVPIILKSASPAMRGYVLKLAALLLIIMGILTMVRGSAWMHVLHGMDHQHMNHQMSQPMDSDMDMDGMTMDKQP